MFIRLDVAQLSREQMLQMIKDYDVLEQTGAATECELRAFARDIRKSSGQGNSSIGIATLMRDIVFEIYRRLAKENI